MTFPDVASHQAPNDKGKIKIETYRGVIMWTLHSLLLFSFFFYICLTSLFYHCSIAFPSTFSLSAYLATRTCRAVDILHMWSDRGTRLILLVCSQTQLAVLCGQQETWPGLAGARLGGKLTLGGKRLEAAAQVSLHMLVVSGQAQLPGPLQGESSASVPVLEAGEWRRGPMLGTEHSQHACFLLLPCLE